MCGCLVYCRVQNALLWCAGEYARFQPRAAGFQQAVDDDVRGVLEAALSRHSTLTQGNWITVSFAGQEHELLVQKTRPGKAISVIGICSSPHFCRQMLLSDSQLNG